jgi:short chain dehydrogenase
MFALHLSRFLGGYPPPPILQKMNALVHQGPYYRMFYHLYWFVVLVFLAPIIGMILPFLFFVEILQLVLRTNRADRSIEPRKVPESGPPTRYGVVVTGCDSGIGKELALCLAAEGFIVFAGCLQNESHDAFAGMDSSIRPLLVDVTCDEQVDACAASVTEWLADAVENEEERVLHSVVNNAGVGIPGYCDWLDMKDYETCMNGEFSGLVGKSCARVEISMTFHRP